jgi:DNA-directed RNA polymerase specialized sigma24 family protein
MNILVDTTSRNACIIEMLGEVKSMVSNFSRKYRMDYDDCYQHASLLMLEVYPTIPDDYNVKAYLNATVRRGLYALLKRHAAHSADTVSIEKPIDDKRTYLDILQAPEQSCIEDDEKAPAVLASEITDVVYTALRECRLEEQEYACMAFDLTDYTPVPNEKQSHRSLLKQERRTDNLLRSIKRVFRKHPQVQGLIQCETCVL